MKNKVLITGATGSTGGPAVQRLLELNVPVRVMVRKIDERSEQLAVQGAEVVIGDLTDFESISAALKDIAGAYFVYDIKVPGLLESTAYFAQAAIEQGVGHIVNMSQISARRDSESHAAQNHWIAERLLDRTGIPTTHLRPTFFSEWLMYFAEDIKANSRIVLPFGDARYAPIAGEDIGRVIAAILANPKEHVGQTYPLFGLSELSQYEVAEIMSEELQRKITYYPMESPEFGLVLKAFGFTPYFIQHIQAVGQDCRNGLFSGTNDLVEKISGSKPLDMTDYIRKNLAQFRLLQVVK